MVKKYEKRGIFEVLEVRKTGNAKNSKSICWKG